MWTYVYDVDQEKYIPRQVTVLYGPDANDMYVILKDNGVTDRTGVIARTAEEIEALLRIYDEPVQLEPEVDSKPRVSVVNGSLHFTRD